MNRKSAIWISAILLLFGCKRADSDLANSSFTLEVLQDPRAVDDMMLRAWPIAGHKAEIDAVFADKGASKRSVFPSAMALVDRYGDASKIKDIDLHQAEPKATLACGRYIVLLVGKGDLQAFLITGEPQKRITIDLQ